MNKVLETYSGFEGLGSIVDVGGGIGTVTNMIVSKYPNIKAINFDLPHVINEAPSYPGVFLFHTIYDLWSTDTDTDTDMSTLLII